MRWLGREHQLGYGRGYLVRHEHHLSYGARARCLFVSSVQLIGLGASPAERCGGFATESCRANPLRREYNPSFNRTVTQALQYVIDGCERFCPDQRAEGATRD